MSNRGNQLTVITLGMILLGGTILGSTPFAFADDHDDKKEKLKDLLEKIKAKIKQKNDDGICKGNHYGEICDNKKPSVEIKKPDSGKKFDKGITIIVKIKAKDKQTGIDKVEVFVNNAKVGDATLVSGDNYELPVDFNDPGRIKLKVTATDKAGNTASDRVNFKIIE